MPKNTLAAQIRAEPDLKKKLALAMLGHDDPVLALAVEFSKLRKFDFQDPKTGQLARSAVHDAANRVRKHFTNALLNWQPEFFERLAKAMRKVARVGVRSFESGFKHEKIERLKWIEVLELEIHNSDPQNPKVSVSKVAKLFPRVCVGHGLMDRKFVASADTGSIERSMRRIRKTLGLPPLTRNGD
jgi:hypothetical protein